MHIITSFCIAIAMYSRIPMVPMEWSKERMKYSLAFFPVVGLIILGVQLLWFWGAGFLGISSIFYAALATAIPVLITGGIHLDGYCDTTDALASYQPREKRLQILKDSNAGAFAIIWTIIYSMIYFGACTELASLKMVLQMSIGYIIARAFSGIAAIQFPSANKQGSLAAFSTVSAKKVVQTSLLLILILCGGVELYLNVFVGIAIVVGVCILFFYYYKKSCKEFGGITGDLAGWFTVKCELLCLLIVVFGTKLIEKCQLLERI